MAVKLKKRVVRETNEVDSRTGKPLIIMLAEGGKLVRIKVKNERTWYTVSIKEIYVMGGRNKADDIKREKLARKEERKRLKLV